MRTYNLPRNSDGTLSSWAWPGGYPVFYVCEDNSTLCPDCARKQELANKDSEIILASEKIVAANVDYESDYWYLGEIGNLTEALAEYAGPVRWRG